MELPLGNSIELTVARTAFRNGLASALRHAVFFFLQRGNHFADTFVFMTVL